MIPLERSEGLAALLMVVGLVLNFHGYQLFRSALRSTGLILCAGVALAASESGFPGNVQVAVIAAVVGGFVGVVLLSQFYVYGLFVLGGSLGYLFAAILVRHGLFDSSPGYYALVLAAIAGGCLAVLRPSTFLTLSTALVGSHAIVHGMLLLAGEPRGLGPVGSVAVVGTGEPKFDLAVAVLVLVGVVVQLRFVRHDAAAAQLLETAPAVARS